MAPTSIVGPPRTTKGLSRRQRKNRRRDDGSPPQAKQSKQQQQPQHAKPTTASPSAVPASSPPSTSVPLRQFAKLGVTEEQRLAALLRHYMLSPEQLLNLGYPVESDLYPGRAIIFKSAVTAPPSYNPFWRGWDVNAREFVPGMAVAEYGGDSSDSSGSAEERASVRSSGEPVVPAGSESAATAPSSERQCVRCGRGFFVAADGEYLTRERCQYHWGRLRAAAGGGSQPPCFTCCRARAGTPGCSRGRLHVWNGVGVGLNGPFEGYARTKLRSPAAACATAPAVYALDCEMCYTARGLELAKVTMVRADGRLMYDCLVRPEGGVVDYNTRFSGITAHDLRQRHATKTLRDVQNDLMAFISADTILVGHGLENDLRALRIVHGTVVDTAVTFPHYNGLPYRRSLRSLASSLLHREIQTSASGHDSCEDARTAMELMLWRVRKDFRNVLHSA